MRKKVLHRNSISRHHVEKPGKTQIPRISAATALFVLVLAVVTGVLPCAGEGIMTLDKNDNGRKIRIAAGETFRVELEHAGATGYSWEIRDLDTQYLEVLETETRENPLAEGVTGAPVTRTWVLKAKKAKTIELKILLNRPWEKNQAPADTYTIILEIF
jgi:predicted secreted protein